MSEPAKEAFEEILRAAEARKIRQQNQAYQLAHSLADEPFFCLKNDQPREIALCVSIVVSDR